MPEWNLGTGTGKPMLHKTINEFFARYYGRGLTGTESMAIKKVLDDHGISNDGTWLTNLFEDLQGKRLNTKIELKNASYPDGDNGFSNLLADLNADHGFTLGNFEDYGEGIEWTLETLGLKFFLTRESTPGYYTVEPVKH